MKTDVEGRIIHVGRPSKLTPERKKRIIDSIRIGGSLEGAAEVAGIHRSTFYNWMDRGKNAKKGEYRDFFDTVTVAKAEAEMILISRIHKAGFKDDWKANAWILKNRYGDQYRETQNLDVQRADERKDEMVFNRDIVITAVTNMLIDGERIMEKGGIDESQIKAWKRYVADMLR